MGAVLGEGCSVTPGVGCAVGCTVGCAAPPIEGASLRYSAVWVAESAMPLTVRPTFIWKALTAAAVLAPNAPSAVSFRYPSSMSRFCSVLTAAPVEPVWSVG